MSQPSFLVIAGLASSLVNFRGHLLNRIGEQGYQVHAAAPGLDEDLATRARLEAMGVICHSIPLERAGTNPVRDLGALVSLFRLMRRLRCQGLLAYTVKPVVYGLLAGWMARVPRRFALITGLGYAFTGEAVGFRSRVQTLIRRFYRIALGRADRVFFQNPDDANLFAELAIWGDQDRTTLVNGSGVDLEHFVRMPLPDPPIRFLLIARLLGDKGIREYAAAASAVLASDDRAEFHLVGGFDTNPDSLDRSELDTWIRDGSVIWHGELDDVRPLLASCHVYVLPSYREGTPRTVLEAMATGRAVITTNAPGCRETVAHGRNGLLVPARDATSLAKAMGELMNDPDRVAEMGRQSRVLAEERFDVHRVNDAMIAAMGI